MLAVAIGWSVSCLAQSSGPQPARFPKPPKNCLTVSIGGKEFLVGRIYLDAHQDTVLLKPFGFRKFDFDGWAASRVLYHAVWPRTVVLDSLPPQVSGLEYDTIPQDSTGIPSDDNLTVPDSLVPPTPEQQQ
jgi:hypothetical protein